MSEQKKSVVVSRIVIRIKDRELSLTPEEARELRDILERTVGPNTQSIKEYVPYPVYPHVYPPIPYWDTTIYTVPVNETITIYCTTNTQCP